MVVGMDPETGQLGTPTAEQMAGLSTAMRGREAGASERSAPIHHADGRISMYVGNWMRESSVVRLGAHGRPVFGCLDGPDAAAYFNHPRPAATSAEER